MNVSRIRFFGYRTLRVALLIAAALSLWPATPAGAQSTCNGLPATIIGAAPA